MTPNKPEDIWQRIDVGSPEECWPYTASTFGGRYGRYFLNQKAVLAHRVVFELTHGTIPDGALVMHKCNNKLCCNPAHLTLGDNSRNQRHASSSDAWKPERSGIRGVGFVAARGYWTARAYRGGKGFNLYTGPFKHKAIAARKQWEDEHGVRFNSNGEST